MDALGAGRRVNELPKISAKPKPKFGPVLDPFLDNFLGYFGAQFGPRMGPRCAKMHQRAQSCPLWHLKFGFAETLKKLSFFILFGVSCPSNQLQNGHEDCQKVLKELINLPQKGAQNGTIFYCFFLNFWTSFGPQNGAKIGPKPPEHH